jgi:hypothetical protein
MADDRDLSWQRRFRNPVEATQNRRARQILFDSEKVWKSIQCLSLRWQKARINRQSMPIINRVPILENAKWNKNMQTSKPKWKDNRWWTETNAIIWDMSLRRKNWIKSWRVWLKRLLVYAKINGIIGFSRKMPIFFAENCRKLTKIVIITFIVCRYKEGKRFWFLEIGCGFIFGSHAKVSMDIGFGCLL